MHRSVLAAPVVIAFVALAGCGGDSSSGPEDGSGGTVGTGGSTVGGSAGSTGGDTTTGGNDIGGTVTGGASTGGAGGSSGGSGGASSGGGGSGGTSTTGGSGGGGSGGASTTGGSDAGGSGGTSFGGSSTGGSGTVWYCETAVETDWSGCYCATTELANSLPTCTRTFSCCAAWAGFCQCLDYSEEQCQTQVLDVDSNIVRVPTCPP